MDSRSRLNDYQLTILILSILVKRLGGKVKITQLDIDDISYNLLDETVDADGSLEFNLIERLAKQ